LGNSFDLAPLGDYSLEESAKFIDAWHHAPADGSSVTGHLHLAFLTDGEWEPVGVCLNQPSAGVIRGTVYGGAEVDGVKRQVARILSLDIDGRDSGGRQASEDVPGISPGQLVERV